MKEWMIYLSSLKGKSYVNYPKPLKKQDVKDIYQYCQVKDRLDKEEEVVPLLEVCFFPHCKLQTEIFPLC